MLADAVGGKGKTSCVLMGFPSFEQAQRQDFASRRLGKAKSRVVVDEDGHHVIRGER
jgi:hypothetical protein